jgi:5'-3' exonuclease
MRSNWQLARRSAQLLRRFHCSSRTCGVAATDNGANGSDGSSTLLLVDAMPLLYRSHFAYVGENRKRLLTREGLDTSVVYSFTRSLLQLVNVWRPSHACVVFDPSKEDGPPEAGAAWSEGWSANSTRLLSCDAAGAPGPTWRHALYPGYKSKREATPQEVCAAVPLLRQLLSVAGIPHLTVAGVEADDVLATLACRSGAGTVLLASPDKDFQQLIRPGLALLRWDTDGWALKTSADFEAAYPGLPPARFADFLALAGDASDGIPGVNKVGPKTAYALLLAAEQAGGGGGLEAVLAAGGAAAGARAVSALAAPDAADKARLSLRLAKLVCDVDVVGLRAPLDAWALAPQADGGAALLAHLRELQIYSLDAEVKAYQEMHLANTEDHPF